MTLEEKQLLLKDLLPRQLYGVKAHYQYYDFIGGSERLIQEGDGIIKSIDLSLGNPIYIGGFHIEIENVKPYLRLLSSMTEKEKLHVELRYSFFYHDGVLDNVHIFEAGGYYDRDGNYDPPCEYRERRLITIEKVFDFIHWLNAHHLDYCGLIERDLALEAPEGMYKIE